MIESLKKTAQSAVSALQAAGADKAQANVSYTITHEFNVDGGEFSLFRTLFDKQLAMTAIQGGKKGTGCRSAGCSPGRRWYYLVYGKTKGYIRSDLVKVSGKVPTK